MKRLTREQVQGRKEKAARFTESVVGDPKRAQEIRDEPLEDYATRREFEIANPTRRATMARKTVEDYRAEIADLKGEVAELSEENEALQDQLDRVAEIASGEEDEEEGEDDDQ